MNVAGVAGGLEWGSSAVQKLNKRQWNDTSVLHSCLGFFDKRIQGKNQINYVSYILFTPDFSALSLYRRMERRGLSGYCITRRILSEHASIALKHLVKNRGASVHWLWVFLQAFCSLLTGSILCLCHIISCLPATELSDSVARSCEAFTATFAKNHGHFRSFHGQL